MVEFTLVRSRRQTKKARMEARASSGPPNPTTVGKDGLTTSYKTHMRAEFTIATNPHNGTTTFNAYAAMKDFTQVLLSCDSNMVLRNQRNMDHTITKIEDFPVGQAAFQENPEKTAQNSYVPKASDQQNRQRSATNLNPAQGNAGQSSKQGPNERDITNNTRH
jgi:hypothetical protein